MTERCTTEIATETAMPLLRQTAPAKDTPKEKEMKRQIVCFQFFKVMPEWRRLPAQERAAHKQPLATVMERWNQADRMLTLTYSTVGTRSECDLMLWRICTTVDDLNQMTAELMATPMGGYLETAFSYLAMTKRSQYLIGHEHEGQADSRGFLRPGRQKYIFVYPFWKTRAWYLLPKDERQRLMTEHIRVGPSVPAREAEHDLFVWAGRSGICGRV